jgi:hypothetical protein
VINSAEGSAIGWLMAGDPAIRWQVLRDLLGRDEPEWQAERAKVATTGWGAQLLTHQAADGSWPPGIYAKWQGTHYTLLLLRSLGLAPDYDGAGRGARLLLEQGLQQDGGINYFARRGTSETCITGMVLGVCAYFDQPRECLEGVFEHLLSVQTPDGGWNCQWTKGSKHGSFNTTVNVLEGLYEFERRAPERAAEAREAQARGREFLLAHRLFRSHRTGEVVKPMFMRLSFPPHWHYDILRALDYFQACGSEQDERLEDAILLLRERRQRDWRWNLENRYNGRVWFHLEATGRPSRWNTLRALRVSRWWDAAT